MNRKIYDVDLTLLARAALDAIRRDLEKQGGKETADGRQAAGHEGRGRRKAGA